ncbi:MAG TPA: branched-chain amino acid aminotransferase [Chitinophagaceae bacterium]
MEEVLTPSTANKRPSTGSGKTLPVQKTTRSRRSEVDFSHLGFGKEFADHMLTADFEDGEWKDAKIVPFQPLTISPANATLHYGQSIFEGIKAYKDPQGNPTIFRPDMNFKRFRKSAERLAMPPVPEEIFLEGMKQLVSLDRDWIPDGAGCSLYIRPFIFATDEMIGVKPSEKYKFMIINSPAGPYYGKPVKLFVQEKYVRAFPGGVGAAKTSGNYAASLQPTEIIKKMGYDQILWTDGHEHKYLQECGTMNVFVIIGNKALTPDLSQGTILAGVTRDSVIQLLGDRGIVVEERPVSIAEILEADKNGTLKELFGTGTAASISFVEEITYRDHTIKFDLSKWQVSPSILKELDAIHTGKTADKRGWNVSVD